MVTEMCVGASIRIITIGRVVDVFTVSLLIGVLFNFVVS